MSSSVPVHRRKTSRESYIRICAFIVGEFRFSDDCNVRVHVGAWCVAGAWRSSPMLDKRPKAFVIRSLNGWLDELLQPLLLPVEELDIVIAGGAAPVLVCGFTRCWGRCLEVPRPTVNRPGSEAFGQEQGRAGSIDSDAGKLEGPPRERAVMFWYCGLSPVAGLYGCSAGYTQIV